MHDHAINIRDLGAYRLVSIIDRAADLTGLSVLVRRLPGGIVPGQRAQIAGGKLTLGDDGTPHLVDLSTCHSVFSGAITAGGDALDRDVTCRLLPSLRRSVLANGKPGGLRDLMAQDLPAASDGPDSAFLRRARTVLEDRRIAWSPGRHRVDPSGLVGLGPGFTPSGDDFITGFLAALAVLDASLDVDAELLRDRFNGTTAGGATLLALALEGSFPAYLIDFVADFRSAPAAMERAPAAIDQAVSRAAAHGETSGTDAVTGFLWALSAFCRFAT